MPPLSRSLAPSALSFTAAAVLVCALASCAPDKTNSADKTNGADKTNNADKTNGAESSTPTKSATQPVSAGTQTTDTATPGASSAPSASASSPTAQSSGTTNSTPAAGGLKKFPVSPGSTVKYGTPATVNFATRDGNKFAATVTVKKLDRIPNAQIDDKKTKDTGADRYRIYYDVQLVDGGVGKPVAITPQQLRPAGLANKHKGAFVYTGGKQGCPDQALPMIKVGQQALNQCQAFDIAGPEITEVVLNPDGILNWVTWTK